MTVTLNLQSSFGALELVITSQQTLPHSTIPANQGGIFLLRIRNSTMYIRLFIIVFVIISMLIISTCSSRSLSSYDRDIAESSFWQDLAAAKSSNDQQAYLRRSVVTFAYDEQLLIERKQNFLEAVAAARLLTDAKQPLTGKTLENLHVSFADLLQSVQVISMTAAKHNQWRETDKKNCAKQNVLTPDAEIRTQGIALSAVASLALYDTFLLNCELVLDNEPIRKALNQGDSGLGVPEDQVDGIIRSYLSYAQRTEIYRTLRDIREAGPWWEASKDEQIVWLRERIAASPSGAILSKTRRVPQKEAIVQSAVLVKSDFREIGDEMMNGVSKSFGNTVGLVAYRRGKMYGSEKIENDVRAVLQPGDILLEKTPFRLTDKFIPGFFGHVAIWVGTAEQLQKLGIWNDPLVAQYHEAILAGNGVVEALRDDVQASPLARFLNIDDLCVIRCKQLSDDERRAVILRALRQIGKPYDFNFDVETIDSIVCSELVYVVYTNINWPTDRTIGRWTISPDQVALRVLQPGPLSVVDLWRDGQRVQTDQVEALKQLVAVPQPATSTP